MYTSPNRATWLKGRIGFAEHVEKDMDSASLRRLDEKTTGDYYRVLLATCPESIRGVDYRGRARGICLILDKGLESQRELCQALSRVGR